MRSTAMATIWGTLAVIFGIIALIGFVIVSTLAGSYNGLVNQKTDVEEARANIETDLQRRYDLVPSLVNSVRGAMSQEQKVFEDIAEARTRYSGGLPQNEAEAEAEGEFSHALSRLLVVMENYPELRSIETVNNLMVQIEGTENRINVSRKRYNEVVSKYNKKVRSFPTNMLAGMFGFSPEKAYESQAGAEFAPTVNLESVGE